MTGGDNNKAEIDIDGDGLEQVKELEAAADAQDNLTKNAERYDRVVSNLARQRAREEQRAASEAKRAERQWYELSRRLLPIQERRAQAERDAAEATNEKAVNSQRLQEQEGRLD